jgi:hypothetical protein
MFSLFSDIIAAFLILLLLLVLNGDLKGSSIKRLPLYGIFKHRILIQSPYMLLYFYVVVSVVFPGIQLIENKAQLNSHAFVAYSNSGMGLFSFFFILSLQVISLVSFFSIRYKKELTDWWEVTLRLKEIMYRFSQSKTAVSKEKNDEPKSKEPITPDDIRYFFHYLVFPMLFVITNAYFFSNLFIHLKLL